MSEIKVLYNEHKCKKLIKINLLYDTRKKLIKRILITGDFFLYPEEALDNLEANLIGSKLESPIIMKKVEECLKHAKAFGFDASCLTEAIIGCHKNNSKSLM